MSRIIQFVVVLLIFVVGIVFHIRNDTPVTLDFYAASFDVPLSWALVAAFAVGAVIGIIVMLQSALRVRAENRRLQKKHQLATEEIVNLRAIPLKDGP